MTQAFQISEQQASSDIARYRELAPENIEYDPSGKTFRRGARFSPRYVGDLTEHHLLQLLAIGTGRSSLEDGWFDAAPPIGIAHLPIRRTDWAVLARLLDAVREREEIDIEYSSLTGSDSAKTIAPHAFGHGSGRWHVRAWDRERDDFRDYVLGRIQGVAASRGSVVDSACDRLWHETFTIRIGPNPRLCQRKRDAVANERGMVEGELRCELPLSMCFYLVQDNQLDLAASVAFGDGGGGTVKPERLQLVALNMPEYRQAEGRARAATLEALARSREGRR